MIRSTSLVVVLASGLCGMMLAGGPTPKTGPTTEKRFPPLKVPPGFKATLFACDPLIEYPSVIAIGPKPGAIFVAIDYMTGLGTDGKVKSEVRLVEDTNGDGYADKATLVAKDFNSIQGIACHDGTLFVMHAPFLTALKYPSTPAPLPGGEGRKDLLSGLGLKPEDNPVRLHCANGVTVGHDGWLYLAIGDNGVNVPRPEGDRLIHNGGCILRCRLDGRDLHVFSTGLRNIYDVALDAELNVFTRDNENDGGIYMIRVCHAFHGSDHGYPYDYYERPEHAMAPIGDFGRGSSAGGVCYLETQLPKEYRGNLFFGEWGKSVVRYDLKRAGAGFANVKEVHFAEGDGSDTYPFKPTDVIVQRDGTLMVADYADGQRPKRGRGRIYHIAYVGQDADPAKKETGLDSESYYERCETQSAIERSGKTPSLKDLSPRGRMHAIWALTKIDGPKAIEPLLKIVATDNDPSVRAQAVRAIADLADPVLTKHMLDAGRGDAKLAGQLATLATGQDPRVQLEIIIAVGRLRWGGAPGWLHRNLLKIDSALAHAAMQAMRRADNWAAVNAILYQGPNHAVRTIALRAVADQYEPIVVDRLIAGLAFARAADRRREYAEVLARVYKKPSPWKYWGYRPGPRPANSVAWERTEAIAKALDDSLTDEPRGAHIATLNLMLREKIPVKVATLQKMHFGEFNAADEAAILQALGEQSAPVARNFLYKVAIGKGNAANRLLAFDLFLKASGDKLHDDLTRAANDLEADQSSVAAEVLRRLAKHPKGAPSDLVAKRLVSTNPEIRAAALKAVREAGNAQTGKLIVSLLGDKDVQVRRAAAGAAGNLTMTSAVEPLLSLATDADVGVRLTCLESLRLLKEPRVVPLALKGLNERTLELTALDCLRELGGPEHAGAVVRFARAGPSIDGSIAAVRTLIKYRDRNSTPDKQRREIDRAIAEIHGAGGILAHWEASVVTPEETRDGIVKSMAVSGFKSKFWRGMIAAGAEGHLNYAAFDKDQRGLRFALTDIDVPAATPVEFLGSSRGGLEVWLNGKSIHRRAAPGKYQTDSDRFTATLEKGANRVLVEASSADDSVEFHLRFRRKSAKEEHEKLTQNALAKTGNVERGRKLFLDKEKSQCLKCHQMGSDGEKIGPDLTGVGARFSRIHLIESILEPSRNIAPSYGAFVVTLKNGKTVNGVRFAETETALTIADNQGAKHVLLKAEIDELNPSPVSAMPDGLETRFTPDDFVDLIAFLVSQKEKRAP